MPDGPPRPKRPSTGKFLAAGAIAGALLLIVTLVLIGRTGSIAPESEEQRTEAGESPASRSQGADASASPSDPHFQASDVTSLTVPETVRFAANDFDVERGASYLVSFELLTEKPEESPGAAMYLGVSLTCTSMEDEGNHSIGGTENLLSGKPTSYRNQFLLQPESSGTLTCNVSASAPREDVAAAGTTVELTVTWSVAQLNGRAVEASSADRLPMTIAPGDREIAMEALLPAAGVDNRELEVLASAHVTTCTGVNGSREGGRTWCEHSDLDENGSDFDIEVRVNVIDGEGSSCDNIGMVHQRVDLQIRRHHQLLPLGHTFEVPEVGCGDMVRVAVVVENRGPASLVVHELNSSLVVLGPQVGA